MSMFWLAGECQSVSDGAIPVLNKKQPKKKQELRQRNTSGELFDLEALARLCTEHQRWTFFISSVPLNMPGGVSSPPNVMAIF